jgi:Cu(I)/Ag(I) efflux system membrane fusion protein
MTMPFKLERPEMARGLKPEDPVRFTFRPEGSEPVVTAIERQGTPAHAGHGAGGKP